MGSVGQHLHPHRGTQPSGLVASGLAAAGVAACGPVWISVAEMKSFHLLSLRCSWLQAAAEGESANPGLFLCPSVGLGCRHSPWGLAWPGGPSAPSPCTWHSTSSTTAMSLDASHGGRHRYPNRDTRRGLSEERPPPPLSAGGMEQLAGANPTTLSSPCRAAGHPPALRRETWAEVGVGFLLAVSSLICLSEVGETCGAARRFTR